VDAKVNIFERAHQLAETGRSMDAIIRALKAEGYENVKAYLSPSFRRQLKRVRDAAKQSPP